MREFKELNVYEKINFICQYVQSIIGLVGIVGNILAICVLQRKSLKKYSYSFYWRILACSDIIVLIHTFRHWLKFILDFDIDLLSPVLCRFNEYQPYVAGYISLWLLTVISIDRLVTIVYPNRFGFIKRRPFQIAVIAIILVYSLFINILLPLNSRLVKVEFGNYTTKSVCHQPIEVLKLNSLIFLVNIIIVNIFINIIIDIRIICFLFMSRKSHIQRRSRSYIKDQKFTYNVIVLNINSVILKLLVVLAVCLPAYLNLDSEKSQLVFTIFISISIIDHSDLFFINILVNSIFYKEFINMIRPKSGHRLVSSDS